MLNMKNRVLECDFIQASREVRCIDECINVAAAGMAMNDLNMVRDRINDAVRSLKQLDKLIQYKKDHDMAREFVRLEELESYETKMQRGL